jgi:hypothetical protein
MNTKGSPYPFLSSFAEGDAGRFFGREQEVNILVADIVTARLVVLFAKTGTGKTSLINAGVVPVLTQRGYETYYVRVQKDPVVSARAALRRDHPTMFDDDGAFGEQLVDLSADIGRPIVVFFDQFEEFFLYVANDEPELADAFVAAIGDIYDAEDSGVHVVFSMREEFFVELDLLRDRVPTIYHADSNLRLQHLRPDQAERAIVGPAEGAGVTIAQEVVAAVVADLGRWAGGRDLPLVEPAQLQIVCDGLWSRRDGGAITLADYRALGSGAAEGTVAQAILARRVRRELESIERREDLELVAVILPLLRSDRGTKLIRDVDALAQLISLDRESGLPRLHTVLERLAKAGVVNVRLKRDLMEAVELTHDYLVDRLDAIVDEVGLIWPQRQLALALARFTSAGEPADRTQLDDIIRALPRLGLGNSPSTVAELLLRSALTAERHGMTAFDFCGAHGVDAMAVIERFINDEDRDLGATAATLLVELIEAREGIRTPAFGLLAQMLGDRDHSGEAQRGLARLAGDPGNTGTIRSTAGELLVAFLRGSPGPGQVTPEVIRFLAQVPTDEAVSLLEAALADAALSASAQDALVKLAVTSEVGERVVGLLVTFAAGNLGSVDPRVIRQLALSNRRDTVDVLTAALAYPVLRRHAEDALKLMGEEGSAVAPAARQALFTPVQPRPPEPRDAPASGGAALDQGLAGPVVGSAWGAAETAPLDGSVELLARAISGGNAALLLGPGMHVPPPQEIAHVYPQQDRPPMSRAVSGLLAQEVKFDAILPGETVTDLSRVALLYEQELGRRRLIETLADAVQRQRRPSPLLHALAEMPFPLVITVTWDRLFEDALMMAGKLPRTTIYSPDRNAPTHDSESASPEAPLIVKLYGDLEHPESVVVTEEDHIQHVLRMFDPDPTNPVPLTARYLMQTTNMLAIGFPLSDWHFRLLLRMLARKIDLALRHDMFIVDVRPDPLLGSRWQREHAARFIVEDLWSFVPRLYQRVLGREMAPR